jgi:hypothetical protein
MKEVCKNCQYCHPTYKGGYCEIKNKKIKLSAKCDSWKEKR